MNLSEMRRDVAMANPFDTLAVIAQLSVGFAGFGSIASVLGQRAAGADAKLDAHRLTLMLLGSLYATVFALLPATLSFFIAHEPWVYRGSSLIALTVIIVLSREAARRAVAVRRAPGFSRSAAIAIAASYSVAIGALAFCAAGFPDDRIPGLYLLALMALLSACATNFWLVTRSLLQPFTSI
jgi:hypothetical protein